MSLDVQTSRGISFKQFLKHAFRFNDEQFCSALSRTRQWLLDASVRSKFDNFKAKAKTRDEFVTESFIEFSNTVLEIAAKDYCIPEERQIKLLHTQLVDADEATPDVSIVHISLDGDNIVQCRRLEWRRILGSIQVWYPKETPSRKRAHVQTGHVSEDPPPKRSKSPTNKGATSATVSTVGGRSDQSKHRLTPKSLKSTPTKDCEPGPSSCDSSALYEESAEGELVGSFSNMFSSRGDRTHAFGACLYGSFAKLMFASHTGIIESNEVDLSEEPEIFVIFLSSFATLSFTELGFNSKTGFCNPCNVNDMVTRRLGVQLETSAIDNNQKTQPCLDNILLGAKIVSHKGLVDRSTTVYHLNNADYPIGLVLKYSWQVKTYRREDLVILEARQADPLHTPELFGTAVVVDPSPFEILREACIRKSKQHIPRELRVLVMRRYHPLAELGFGDEFWCAFAQLLGCKLGIVIAP